MGLSIHYSGRLKNSIALRDMIEEVADIAGIFDWPYKTHEGVEDIFGIVFTPTGCETVQLSFLANGRMHCRHTRMNRISVKTQFAGIYVHMLIINLLKYLSVKYLEDFELTDEGQYWETGDQSVLQAYFDTYHSYLDNVTDALLNFPIRDGETFEEYFKRVLGEI